MTHLGDREDSSVQAVKMKHTGQGSPQGNSSTGVALMWLWWPKANSNILLGPTSTNNSNCPFL